MNDKLDMNRPCVGLDFSDPNDILELLTKKIYYQKK